MKAHKANPPTWTSNQDEVHWHANEVLSNAEALPEPSIVDTAKMFLALALEAGGISAILPFALPFPDALPFPPALPPRGSVGALGGDFGGALAIGGGGGNSFQFPYSQALEPDALLTFVSLHSFHLACCCWWGNLCDCCFPLCLVQGFATL